MVLNKIWSISYQNKKYYGKTLNLWIYCVFVPCANFLAQGTVVSLTVYKSYLLRLEDYMSNTKTTFPLYYRGKPLVRNNDTIFFGDMKDPYVIKLQIKSKENSNNLDCANKVTIQLLSTDTEISARKQIIKTGEKENLAVALDLAVAWLERGLAKSSEK